VYKCEVCGNVVQIVHNSFGQLVCCNQPMKLQTENTIEASVEKHIPLIEKLGNKILVKVGSIEHPMTNEHYIEWIEVLTPNSSFKNFLKPSDKPQSEFFINEEIISARAYCNLHGLWKK
jgi:superoxide reductase